MSETVLIVDDSLTVRMDLLEAFEAAGFHCLPCATAAETRQALARDTVDLVVLDVLLPDGDGVDLLNEIRGDARTARTPVLMLSTEGEVKDRIRGLQMGADEYVGKPYDTQYVVSRARELLRNRQGATSGPATILIIDDSVTFREELRAALESAGYAVLVANSGEEGLRLAALNRPTALVIDGILPGVDGATVIRRIRLDAALRSIPCVLLTGSLSGNAELVALDAGADAFVRKEEDVSVILARLGAVLRACAAGAGEKTPASLLGPKKILAVDDSLTYLHALADALTVDGYDVVPAHSGEEALEMLAVQPVDCILLDLMMPGLGGKETCRRIKESPVVRDIPLIMLTAIEDREAVIDGLSTGADDYIPKSGELEVLKARVRAQIRRKQFEDETRHIRMELLQRELEATEASVAKEIAETRAALIEELEFKNKELEAFSYSVSHDLRAPVRSIDGFSQLLLEEYSDKLDATGQEYLQRVRAAALRMGELIDDMLALSRVGRAELSRTQVNLSDAARLVAAEFAQREPGRSVECDIEDGLVAQADRRLIQIVFENLLGNAWKYTGKVVAARIEFRAEPRPDNVVYRVRDNGVGFDMAYASMLFTPFVRLHSNDDFPGTGIGLATVQRIIERHGGRVWAEGAVGQGATVYFTIPPATLIELSRRKLN